MWFVVFVALTAKGLVELYGTPKREKWRSAAALVAARGEMNDAVIFYAYFTKITFEYYFPSHRSHETGIALLDIASGPWRGAKGHASDLPDPDRGRVQCRLNGKVESGSFLRTKTSRDWEGMPKQRPFRKCFPVVTYPLKPTNLRASGLSCMLLHRLEAIRDPTAHRERTKGRFPSSLRRGAGGGF